MRYLILLLTLLTLALPGPAAAQQDDGASLLERLLQENLSGAGRQITIRGFSGALSSTAQIEELTIADNQGVWFTARGIVLNWSRLALLTGRVQVSEFSAAEIILDRTPVTEESAPSPEAAPFSLPDLPVSINIDSLRIDRLEIGEPVFGIANVSRATGSANLSGGEGALSLRLERTDGQRGVFNIAGSYANSTGQLAVNVELDEGPGGIVTTLVGLPGAPALTLSVAGEGPIDDFTADIRLTTSDQNRLTGQVTTRAVDAAPGQPAGSARRFTFDVSGDIRPLLPEEFHDFFGPDLSITADATRQPDGSLAIPAFGLNARSIQLGGEVRIAADGLPSFVDVTGRIQPPAGTAGPVVLPLDTPTELSSADLAIAYDDTVSETWTIDVTAHDFHRPEMAIGTLRLEGGGGVMRQASNNAPRLDANLRFTADGIAMEDAALARAVGPRIEGTTVFVWQSGEGVVTMPVLNVRGEDYRATADLVFNGLNAALRVNGSATAGLDDISRFSDLAGRPLSGRAEVQAGGSFEPLTGMFDIVATATGTDLTADQQQLDRLLAGEAGISLSAKRDETGIQLRQARIQAQKLDVQASGVISSTATDLSLKGSFADAAVLGPGFGGSVDITGRAQQQPEGLRLTFDAVGNDLRVGQPQADGLLRGQSRISFAGLRNDDTLTIDRASVTATTLQATATGRYAPGNTDISLVTDFSDLSVMGTGFGGSIAGTSRLHDTPDGLRVETDMRGQDLNVGQPQADGLLRGESVIGLAAVQKGERITVERLNVTATTLSLSAAGRYDPADTDLTAQFRFTDLSVLGAGFRGALTADAHALSEAGGIRLTADARASGLAIGNQPQVNALLRGDGSLSLDLLRTAEGYLKVDRFSFQNPQMSANAQGQVQGSQRQVTIDGRLNNLGILVPQFPGPLTLQGTVSDTGGPQLQVDLGLRGPGQIDTRLSGGVARDFATTDLALTGSAQLGLVNAFLGARSVQGGVRFDLTLRGAPTVNALGGSVTASNVRFVDPTLGVALSGGTARVDLASGTARIDARAAVEGGGSVTANGTVGLTAPFNANLNVTARDARVQDPQLYTTTVNGAIAVTGPLTGGGRIAGALTLGQTEVRVPSSFGGTFTIPVVEHIAEPRPVHATRVRAGLIDTEEASGGGSGTLALDITVSARNRIFIRGRGLDAELGGSIHLGGTTANVVPSGQFNLIRGRLDFLDRRLDLTSGSFFIQGDFDAFINLTATTTTPSLTANITVTGPVSDPDIVITSNPSLPEEEVLAQLIFGRDLSSISPLQAAQLASAIATLSGSGGDGLVSRFRRSAGLDNLDIVTDDEGNAGVRAGRYLSSNVYTEVVVGSGNQSQINLNLDVTRSLTVRGTVGQNGSTGIGLFFERDY